jgi:hypothetical protein
MGHAKHECYSGHIIDTWYYGSDFLRSLKSNNSHEFQEIQDDQERQKIQESHVKTASMERMRSCYV